MKETNYIVNNPVSWYISAYIEDEKRAATDLPKKLEEMFDELSEEVLTPETIENFYGKNICVDLVRLYDILNDDVNAKKWEGKYGTLYPVT